MPGSKAIVALLLLAALAAAAWFTLAPGVPRTLTLVLLAGFALRIALVGLSSR